VAITDKSKVKLDLSMEAPIIVLPVSSRSPATFEANLGKLSLANHHRSTPHFAHTILTDIMSFKLSDMSLSRSRAGQGRDHNTALATATIVHPISFELDITRNMEGAYKEDDLPEVKIEGTLHQVKAELSKDDYNTLMALVVQNFQEQGVLEKEQRASSLSNKVLSLPIKSRASTKYNSQASLASVHSDIRDNLTRGKSDLAKLAEFGLVFKGFGLTIFKDQTELSYVKATARDPRKALAGINILSLTVDGNYRVSGAVKAVVRLSDVVLEDVRKVEWEGVEEGHRITRLFEAKKIGGERRKEMITVRYVRDKDLQESVDVHVSSFVVVASVSYLLEIATFFIPEDLPDFGDVPEGALLQNDPEDDGVEEPLANTRTVTVKVEEPDNIEDIDTDALMLNAELSINLTQAPDRLSFVLTVDR
jgi:hypothetical protein